MPRMMRAKRCFDEADLEFAQIQTWLAQTDQCTRRGLAQVAEQADVFSELESKNELLRGKRVMVTLTHPCEEVEDLEENCDCSLYDAIDNRESLRLRAAAFYLAKYFGTGVPEFGECEIPEESNVSILFLTEPFCSLSAHDAIYLLQKVPATTAFIVNGDNVADLIARYASEFRRLDQQYHCRALAADNERWELLEHERGELDPLLVAEHYGNAFRQQKVEQPSLHRFLVPKSA